MALFCGRKITGPVPGPKSQAALAQLFAYECAGITARQAQGMAGNPIVWQQAQGCYVQDVDENVFLDFSAAFAVSAYGHCHPALVAALTAQAQRLMHGMGDVYPSDVKIAFSEALAAIAPGDLRVSMLGQSGADAVEMALKTATLATGRSRVLAFYGSYHGLSLGALGVSAYRDAFRAPFKGSLNHNVTHVPYPYCLRCPYKLRHPSCGLACLENVRSLLRHPAAGAEEMGAVLIEPIQGRGGVVPCPPTWLAGLAECCREAGVLLIFDEIYTGFGRTGRVFACEHEGVVPDLMCLGKAMTGAFPMSALIGTPAVMAAWGENHGEAVHTSTFLGNPMGCALGLAALKLLQEEHLEVHAALLGEELRRALLALQRRYPDRIAEVRGRGLMLGMELVKDRHSLEPDPAAAVGLMQALLARGVLVLPSGRYGQVLSVSPPLVATQEMVQDFLTQLALALEEVL